MAKKISFVVGHVETGPEPGSGGKLFRVTLPADDEAALMSARRALLSDVSARKLAELTGVAARNTSRVVRALISSVDVYMRR